MATKVKKQHIVVANGLGAYGRPVQRILLEDGYEYVNYVAGGAEVLALCSHMWVDLVLLDLDLPDMDGLAVVERLVPAMRKGRLQVIVITDKADDAQRRRALEVGVRDFVAEPIDPQEVKMRVNNALLTSLLQGELIARNTELAEAIAGRSQELTRAREEVLRHLATAAEMRDDETGEHTERVGRTSAVIARACGLPPDVAQLLAAAAPLHDVGKIGVPDRILLKPGLLTASERKLMQKHARIGAEILADSDVPELRLAETIALRHHEHWDGNGYPDGLRELEIPFAARIVAIADVFDALLFARPYKPAWTLEAAVQEIRDQSAKQFDPELVEVFAGLDHEYLRSPIVRERSTVEGQQLVKAPEPAGASGAAPTRSSRSSNDCIKPTTARRRSLLS